MPQRCQAPQKALPVAGFERARPRGAGKAAIFDRKRLQI